MNSKKKSGEPFLVTGTSRNQTLSEGRWAGENYSKDQNPETRVANQREGITRNGHEITPT